MILDIGHFRHLAIGDRRRLQALDDLVAGQPPERVLNGGVGVSPARHAVVVGGEAGVGCQIRSGEDGNAELLPFDIVLDRDQEGFAIGRVEDAVGRDGRMCEAEPLRGRIAVAMRDPGHVHPVHQRMEERHLDMGPLARPPAQDQRLENGLVGMHPGGDVADRNADPGRTMFGSGDR